MDTTKAIILAAVFALVAFRIYQKYLKKDSQKSDNKGQAGKDSFTSTKDDYEPYSEK